MPPARKLKRREAERLAQRHTVSCGDARLERGLTRGFPDSQSSGGAGGSAGQQGPGLCPLGRPPGGSPSPAAPQGGASLSGHSRLRGWGSRGATDSACRAQPRLGVGRGGSSWTPRGRGHLTGGFEGSLGFTKSACYRKRHVGCTLPAFTLRQRGRKTRTRHFGDPGGRGAEARE